MIKMKNKKNRIELLAPAGNLHKLKTALAFGADAVYAGIPDFSLRVRINNFDMDGIKEAVKYCHQNNKKIYITLNIFAHNKHFKNLEKYLKFLKFIKVDGLIISDPGILEIVKKVWPRANIHLSTQANCTNAQAALFWQKQGVGRIILGREVTLKEIKEIHKACPGLELEYFVHGAMCMAYSGRCFLSSLTSTRSANLGDCIQPCRWKYVEKSSFDITQDRQIPNPKSQINPKHQISNSKQLAIKGCEDDIFEVIEEKHGSYILNSKDLCLIKYLRDLEEAGVCSFKIEGRAKSAYYQAMVAGIYSHVTHNIEHITEEDLAYYYSELKIKIINRGYCTGFLLGDRGEQNTDNSHENSDWEFCGQVLSIKNEELRIKKLNIKNFILIKVHNSLKVGDEVEIVKPKYDIIKMKVDKLFDSETGEKLQEAHGGQGRMVMIEVKQDIPVYSVIRRKIVS
ncbi:U32 family peptidase C-terminal domain-containing protein [Candidatus Parcubacteria bacterium]|nr:U32 family peptidase C-terminal domain-containing protein [Candidatus Parcubacteria bacterium]